MFFEEDVALLEFVVFLDGVHIDGAHGIEALGEFGDEFLDAVPGDAFGFAGRFRCDFRGSWFGLSLGSGFGAFGLVGFALVAFAESNEERVGVRLEGLEVCLVALGGMAADVFHAHFGLGGLHLDAAALILELGELLAGGAEGGFDGFGGFHNLGPLREDGGQAGFLGFQRGVPFGHRGLERGVLGGEGFDAGFVVGNIGAAGVEEFVEFHDAGGHGAALAVEALLLLALGGYAHADFVEGVVGRAFAFADDLDAGFAFRSGGAQRVERAGGFGDAGFEFGELGQAAAEAFLDAGGFALERGALGFRIGKLAFGEAAFVVYGGCLELRGLHGLAGVLQALHGVLHGGGCGGAGCGEGFDFRGGFGKGCLEFRDADFALEDGLAGVFPRGASMDDAVAGDERAVERGEGKGGVFGAQADGGLEGLDDEDIAEQAAGERGAFRVADDAIRGAAERAEGNLSEVGGTGRNPFGGDDGGEAEFLPGEGGEGGFGDSGVLENDGLERGAEGGFDSGDEAFLDLDVLGERALDGGMVEVGVVEATEERLGSLVEALALLLKLAEDFEAGLDGGGFLACGIEDGLGVLPFDLGVLVVGGGGGGFRLGLLEGEVCGLRASLEVLEVGGDFAGGAGGGFKFVLEEVQAGFARFAATGGCGDFAPERVQAGIGVGKFGALVGEFAFGSDALGADRREAGGVFVEGFLVGAQALDHLLEQGIGLLDLLLLGADFFVGLRDVEPVALDEGLGLCGALVVRRDAVFGGECPVAEGLHTVADGAGLGLEFLQALAEGVEFALLLGNFRLVDVAGFLALRELGAQRGKFVRELAVVFMGDVGVEDAEVGEDRLVAAGLRSLALEGADLAFHFLDDVLDADEVRLGVFELAEGFLFLGLEFRDARGLFENRAAVFRAVAEDLVDLPLLHDRVGAAAHAGVHEQLVDVAQAARGFVEEILALAVAVDAARDSDLVPIGAEFLFAFGEGHRDLGHAERGAAVGAAENDIGHFAAAEGFCGLLAENPAHGVEDIRLSAAVRADDGGDAAVEIQDGFCGEGFEADDFEGLQIHGRLVEWVEGKRRVRCRKEKIPYPVPPTRLDHNIWTQRPIRGLPNCWNLSRFRASRRNPPTRATCGAARNGSWQNWGRSGSRRGWRRRRGIRWSSANRGATRRSGRF